MKNGKDGKENLEGAINSYGTALEKRGRRGTC